MLVSETAHALTVSPPVAEVIVQRGEKAERAIRLYNETDREVVVVAELMDVDFDEGRDVPIFKNPSGSDQVLSSWIDRASTSFALAPGVAVDVPIAFTIPKEAIPGSYAAAILFSGLPSSTSESAVGIEGKIATILLVTVPGEVRYEGELVDFGLADGKTIRSSAPDGFRVRIKNSGDVFFVPTGTVEIKNMFGHLSEEVVLNVDDRRVLPGWTRTFISEREDGASEWLREWQPFAIGRYTATLQAGLGERTFSRDVSYWVWPWRTMGLAVLVVLGGWWVTKRKNKYETKK